MKKNKKNIFPQKEFNAVQNAYIKLFQDFKTACDNESLKVTSPNAIGFSYENMGDKMVEFKFFLLLSNWPYKKEVGKELDIFLTSNETFSFETNEVIKSNVGLKYLKNNKDQTVHPLLDIHYDYEKDVKSAHPVFHVQLGAVEISSAAKEQVHFRKTIPKSDHLLYSNVRIPTPYMNITSVLLSLAADHLSFENYQMFLGSVRESEAVKWKVACSPLGESLQKDGNVHSHIWYFDERKLAEA
jgi:hypothetical protein